MEAVGPATRSLTCTMPRACCHSQPTPLIVRAGLALARIQRMPGAAAPLFLPDFPMHHPGLTHPHPVRAGSQVHAFGVGPAVQLLPLWKVGLAAKREVQYSQREGGTGQPTVTGQQQDVPLAEMQQLQGDGTDATSAGAAGFACSPNLLVLGQQVVAGQGLGVQLLPHAPLSRGTRTLLLQAAVECGGRQVGAGDRSSKVPHMKGTAQASKQPRQLCKSQHTLKQSPLPHKT